MRLSAPERRRGERPVRKGRRAGIVQARRPEVRGCAEARPVKSPYWPRDEEAAATWRVAGVWFGGGGGRGGTAGGGGGRGGPAPVARGGGRVRGGVWGVGGVGVGRSPAALMS